MKGRDLQLFWVVVCAAVFWIGLWQRDAVLEYSKKFYSVATGIVSGGGRAKVSP